jgi:hypothetical protein
VSGSEPFDPPGDKAVPSHGTLFDEPGDSPPVCALFFRPKALNQGFGARARRIAAFEAWLLEEAAKSDETS